MNSGRYDRMKDLFVQASEMESEQRKAFLDVQCAGDEPLRQEVEDLLRHHDEPTSTITAGSEGSAPVEGASGGAAGSSRGSGSGGSARMRPRNADVTPSRVAGYRIVREIGRGGMGLVYLGVREEGRFQRRAAIKVIKKGMDSEDVLRRFELERQLLSALNHNNIARLFDGGTTEDGRPYFALEYVEGLPIDVYCDRNRLTIDERLNLFKQVCAAVAYAHRNLVVHRDIKPANIIVTEDGTVKLLDFGIAKLLNPDLTLIAGDPTAPEMRVMTPEYASPEQVRGEKITTASDVYSLGVLLYELLTGHRPYRIKERIRSEIERIICEQEPERPSTAISKIEELPDRSATPGTAPAPSTRTVTPESVSATRSAKPDALRRRLAGDIDNIILMAMRKESIRRYTSVERLAEDIDRHLNNLPVSARPASLVYRSTKFVRRNRAGVAIAALVALTSGLFIGLALQSHAAAAHLARANEETALREMEEARAVAAESQRSEAEALAEKRAALAERRAMSVRDLAQVFLFDFNEAIEQLEGATKARELLVTTALAFLQDIEADQDIADDPLLALELARAYDQVGDVRGGRRGTSLGNVAGAIESYEKALELRLSVADRFDDARIMPELAQNYRRLGDGYVRLGDTAAQAEAYLKQYETAKEWLDGHRNDLRARHLYAWALQEYGAALMRLGDHHGAKERYHRALEQFESVRKIEDTEQIRRHITVLLLYLAVRYHVECDYEKAIEYGERSLQLRAERMKDVHTRDPANAQVRRDVAIASRFVGLIHLDAGDFQTAQMYFEADRDHLSHLAQQDPNDSRARRDRGASYINLGELLYRKGDLDAALRQFRTANSYLLTEAAWDPDDALVQREQARAHQGIGRTLAALAANDGAPEFAEAIDELRKAIGITTALLTSSPEDARYREDLAGQQVALANVLILSGAKEEARDLLRESSAAYEKLLEDAPENCHFRHALGEALGRKASLAAAFNDPREGIRYVQQAFEMTGQRLPVLLSALAQGHRLLGEHAKAQAALREAIAQLEEREYLTYDERLLRDSILAQLGR